MSQTLPSATDAAPATLATAAPIDLAELTSSVRLHEYTRAANPVGRQTPRVPMRQFPASMHSSLDHTVILSLDVSDVLGIRGPATSPALSASFVHVAVDDPLSTSPVSTSELYYVISGAGTTYLADTTVPWSQGDVFVLPAGAPARHVADGAATFYRVTDEPLLRHLGVAPLRPTFPPTLFRAQELRDELARIEQAPHAGDRNRMSVLLATAEQGRTLTITNVLWAMYGVVPPAAVQKPHRHQSVALDFIVHAPEGCYTLVGRTLSPDGEIVDPVQVDWETGCAFITPPGLWHAHHNESDEPAYLLPVQDAGLQTHLTSLDIRFG